MKKFKNLKVITLFLVLTISFASCSDSEDSPENNNCSNNSNLVNTVWIGDGDRDGEKITFTSVTEYFWEADYGNRNGSYCFDGANGNFDEVIRFTLSGDIITLNSEDQGGTGKFYKQ